MKNKFYFYQKFTLDVKFKGLAQACAEKKKYL